MIEPTAKHWEEARESGAVVRIRKVGGRKSPTDRLRFTCRKCGGRWKTKADADECCACSRETTCRARSHYGDCRSMSYRPMPISGLTGECACQGGWICPACADVLRTLSSRDTEIREVLEALIQAPAGTVSSVTKKSDTQHCWCFDRYGPREPHSNGCLAARGLWERVQVSVKKEESDVVK